MTQIKWYKSGLIWCWISILVIAIDRVTKTWALHHLDYLQPKIITPFFNLTLAYNTGAAFSFLDSAKGWQNIFLGGLAMLICLGVVIWLARLPANAKWNSIALGLILGGALGNVWDRIVYHFVIDLLSFHLGDWYFAIFNVADSAISVGACMLILHWMFVKDRS